MAWQPGKRDMIFIAVVAAVILTLALGSHERKTKAVPNDAQHQQATSREACMQCHGVDGVKPQPMRHTQADQCFQCHAQPDGWQGK
ncbi:MAG: hypothetical protein HQM07_01470 [Zetaproteobacteria bacterium]|nr:hypothetical protein [Zetaproteobacteria bacterium]